MSQRRSSIFAVPFFNGLCVWGGVLFVEAKEFETQIRKDARRCTPIS
jgi:hypothetical protein